MHNADVDQAAKLRLLESWLPLAQAENRDQEWGLDSEQLEALILLAAPALRGATSKLAARAILWHHRRQAAQEAV